MRIIIFHVLLFCIGFTVAFSQGTWTQKANFGGTARQEAAGFSIGTKAYIGTGWNGGCMQDFWEWDPLTNVWTQKANFGGGNRQGAFHFSIGTKGYIGLGWNCSSDLIDFWEWDQATNVWMQKANFPGTPREDGSSFSIGTKGYIGTGVNTNNSTNPSDFWEWDQTTNVWTQRANFGGVARLGTTLRFSIGTKGYIGLGGNNSLTSYYNDFWEWDQATNVWTQKANFGGTARAYASGFAICNKVYVGTGKDASSFKQDFWEWNQATNTWTQQTNFPAAGRFAAIGISIGNKGYLGTGGLFPSNQFFNDFWEFTPSNPCNTITVTSTSQNILCNAQCSGSSTVNSSNGTAPYTYNWSNGQTSQTATGLCAGTYSVSVTDASSTTISATVIITQPAAISSSANSTSASCLNNNGSATVTANGGTPAYSYSWNPSGQTTQTATGLTAGTYSAIISDANGCTKTQTITVTANSPLTVSVFSTQTGCTENNGTALANPGNGTAPYTYSWNNGQTSQTATGLGVGTYTVSVADVNGCVQSQTVTVISSPGPAVSVSAISITVSLGDSTQLSATGGGTYQWSPSTGLSCTTCAYPVATPAQNTTYCVLVTDSNGCTNSACITIEILCGNLYVPNAFSPNNDAENDFECVMGNCIKTLYFAVYNRWGEKMFETTNQKICWDGKYNGKAENTAVFSYYLEATLTNGAIINKKGNISLVR